MTVTSRYGSELDTRPKLKKLVPKTDPLTPDNFGARLKANAPSGSYEGDTAQQAPYSKALSPLGGRPNTPSQPADAPRFSSPRPVARGEASLSDIVNVLGKAPLVRPGLAGRRDTALIAAGVDPLAARDYSNSVSDQAKAINKQLRDARMADFRIRNDRSIDPMLKAQQLAALGVGDLEAKASAVNRASADSRRLITPNASDQTPAERAAARDALNAQLPGIRSGQIASAAGGVESAKAAQLAEVARRLQEMNKNSASFTYPGTDLGTNTAEGQNVAGQIRTSSMIGDPNGAGAVEGKIGAGSPYEQWTSDQRAAGLNQMRQRWLGRLADANQIPNRIDFGEDTTDTGATGRLAAQINPQIAAYKAATRQGGELANAEGEAAVATAKGKAQIAALEPQLMEAQIGAQKAGYGTQALQAQAASNQAKQAVTETGRQLADTTAITDENQIRNSASRYISQLNGAGSLTLPHEAVANTESARASIVEPLKRLAATGSDGSARARKIAREIMDQFPTPWSFMEFNPIAPGASGTSLMRQGVAQLRYDLANIGNAS